MLHWSRDHKNGQQSPVFFVFTVQNNRRCEILAVRKKTSMPKEIKPKCKLIISLCTNKPFSPCFSIPFLLGLIQLAAKYFPLCVAVTVLTPFFGAQVLLLSAGSIMCTCPTGHTAEVPGRLVQSHSQYPRWQAACGREVFLWLPRGASREKRDHRSWHYAHLEDQQVWKTRPLLCFLTSLRAAAANLWCPGLTIRLLEAEPMRNLENRERLKNEPKWVGSESFEQMQSSGSRDMEEEA